MKKKATFSAHAPKVLCTKKKYNSRSDLLETAIKGVRMSVELHDHFIGYSPFTDAIS